MSGINSFQSDIDLYNKFANEIEVIEKELQRLRNERNSWLFRLWSQSKNYSIGKFVYQNPNYLVYKQQWDNIDEEIGSLEAKKYVAATNARFFGANIAKGDHVNNIEDNNITDIESQFINDCISNKYISDWWLYKIADKIFALPDNELISDPKYWSIAFHARDRALQNLQNNLKSPSIYKAVNESRALEQVKYDAQARAIFNRIVAQLPLKFGVLMVFYGAREYGVASEKRNLDQILLNILDAHKAEDTAKLDEIFEILKVASEEMCKKIAGSALSQKGLAESSDNAKNRNLINIPVDMQQTLVTQYAMLHELNIYALMTKTTSIKKSYDENLNIFNQNIGNALQTYSKKQDYKSSSQFCYLVTPWGNLSHAEICFANRVISNKDNIQLTAASAALGLLGANSLAVLGVGALALKTWLQFKYDPRIRQNNFLIQTLPKINYREYNLITQSLEKLNQDDVNNTQILISSLNSDISNVLNQVKKRAISNTINSGVGLVKDVLPTASVAALTTKVQRPQNDKSFSLSSVLANLFNKFSVFVGNVVNGMVFWVRRPYEYLINTKITNQKDFTFDLSLSAKINEINPKISENLLVVMNQRLKRISDKMKDYYNNYTNDQNKFAEIVKEYNNLCKEWSDINYELQNTKGDDIKKVLENCTQKLLPSELDYYVTKAQSDEQKDVYNQQISPVEQKFESLLFSDKNKLPRIEFPKNYVEDSKTLSALNEISAILKRMEL